MADNTTQESVIFEIKLDAEQYRSEQKLVRDSLGQLVLDIEKTKQAQKSLDDTRKAGKVSDADYSAQSVKLREQLKGQQTDQRELAKALETSQRVMVSGAGSIDQLRARLSELTVTYNALSQAERDNSEEGKRLQAEARAVSEELKKQEGLIGDNRRNVGGYATAYKQGLVGIVAELVKVAAAQKGVDATSEQGMRLETQRIGFQTAAQRAAAQAGITDFTQAQAAIDQYSQALTPAVENLVQLQQQQQQVGQTAGEASQEYQALGFKIAGAEKSLTDLVAAQQAAGQAARAGGAAVQGQAAAAEVAAGSLAALRQELTALQQKRETLDPTTKEAEELNTTILKLRSSIQQAEGKIDEFGERVQKNIKKENFDTVSDAIQGLTGATAVASIVFGDNADAAKVQARAMQLMTIATSARSIAVGIGSARDAASIVWLNVRNLLFKQQAAETATATAATGAHAAAVVVDTTATEAQATAAALNTEAQVASTEASVAGAVATEAQAVATGGLTLASEAATVAAEGFAAAFALTGIGTVIVLLALLAGGLFAYSKASDNTKEKINRFVEALFRFGTPIGLILTGLGKLYDKFETVRKVVDPVIAGLKAIGQYVADDVRAFGEFIGVLDTAEEKAAKFAAAQLERGQAQRELADAEVKALELAGAAADDVTRGRIENVDKLLAQQREANRTADVIHEKELKRIAAEQIAKKDLSDSDKQIIEEQKKGQKAVVDLINERNSLINEGIERNRTARQQEAKDVQTNAQRAVQSLQVRLERQDAADNAAAKRRLARLDIQLGQVRQHTTAELFLQRQKVDAQAALEIQQARQTLAEKVRLRAVGYAPELAALKAQEAQAVEQAGLTEKQKTQLRKDYAQQRADLDTKYDVSAARRAVAEIPVIRAQANAAKLKLSVDFSRQEHAAELEAAVELTRAQVAQSKEGSQQRYDLTRQLIDQEEQLALAGLNRRAMSEAEYQGKMTAITADGVAKRKALGQSLTDDAIKLLGEEQQGAELNQQLLLAGKVQTQQTDIKASKAYHNELLRAEINRHAAALLATEAGTKERENVEKQHALNLKSIEAETTQAQVQLVAEKFQKIADLTSQSLSAIGTIQDAASQAQLARIDAEMNREGVSAARKAVLEKQKLRIEQEATKQRQRLARAQAVVQLGQAVMAILAAPSLLPSPAGEILKVVGIAAATATAYAQFKAIDSAKFATGGVVAVGPSHAQGGIQLTNRGRAVGIEIEGGEAVINRRSTALFGPLLSAINQMGGGRALFADRFTDAALMGRLAQGGVVSSSPEFLPTARTGGLLQLTTPAIDYDKLTDMMAAKLGPVFVSGAQALPPQQLNLTELQQRQEAQRRMQQQTDI